MTVKTIVINDQKNVDASPIVRLAYQTPAAAWQHVGYCVESAAQKAGGDQGSGRDLNRAAEAAAQLLLQKVAGRGISVEIVIDPFILPTNTSTRRLVPLILAIAENASASVEPGPGTVVLRTWWRKGYAGVDAVGLGGSVPEEIRANIMRPGFSTRVAEWDTGLGLHAASAAAREISGLIELFEPREEEGVGFRLAFPLKAGSRPDPDQTRVALARLPQFEEKEPGVELFTNWYQTMRGASDVDGIDTLEA